jgi:predicted transcriptional regulator
MFERDYLIIEFLEKFKVATTSQIKELFFPSINTCRRRLKKLIEYKEIKRLRDNINRDYIYFIKEPKQLKHSLAVTDFYINMNKRYKMTNFKVEPNLR